MMDTKASLSNIVGEVSRLHNWKYSLPVCSYPQSSSKTLPYVPQNIPAMQKHLLYPNISDWKVAKSSHIGVKRL